MTIPSDSVPFPGATPRPADEHVAWCRFVKEHDRPTRIVLCDSDADGAFKVYRHSEAKSWRCFHCDFETSDRNEAIGHFGASQIERVLCLLWEDMTEDQRVTELQACRSERDVFEIEVGNLRRLLDESKARGLERAEQVDALRTERDALKAEVQRLREALESIHKEFIPGTRKLYGDPDTVLDRIRDKAASALK